MTPGAEGAGEPPVRTRIRPCRMTLAASVMMIGGTPNQATPAPLTKPTIAPPASISGITQISGASWPPQSSVIRMAAEFSTQGTDRSMPPPMMTKVWPSATMPTKAASTTVERRFDAGQEARRKQRGHQEQHDHAGIGEQDQAVAGDECVHDARALAAFSATELASTASSRMTPEATGCQ